jgi:2-phosphosulfolactate phosphatase
MVFPYRWRDASAEAFAAEKQAHLALPRGETTPEQPYSLSPGSLETLASGARIVLPSPNGSTLTTIAAEAGATVLAGCLRNATAVGQAAAARGEIVTVIASGERWPDDSLRPAIEDLIGAGAILAAMRPTAPSPEAIAAIAAYAAVVGAMPDFIGACSSARELIQIGFTDDVIAATRHDISATVPILTEGAFVNGAGQ